MSEEQKEKQHEHILSMQMIMEECAIDINKKIEHLHNGSKYAINNLKGLKKDYIKRSGY